MSGFLIKVSVPALAGFSADPSALAGTSPIFAENGGGWVGAFSCRISLCHRVIGFSHNWLKSKLPKHHNPGSLCVYFHREFSVAKNFASALNVNVSSISSFFIMFDMACLEKNSIFLIPSSSLTFPSKSLTMSKTT